MMKTSKFPGIAFENVDLKFKPELYLGKGERLPDVSEITAWLASMAEVYYRFGFGYNERSSSFTCSLTYKGGKTTDDAPCVTMHAKSFLSGCQKLWLVFELAGGQREGIPFARDVLAELESRIEDAVARLSE